MRQRRPRPESLNDDVLTAATIAGHNRLAGNTNLNNETTTMPSFFESQMNSCVKVDVREALDKQIALANRASKWINDKAVDQTFVSVGQLASFLKIKKERVPAVIKTIYPPHLHGNEGQLIKLYIFVANNQIPQWLRPLISSVTMHRLLMRASNLDGNSIMEHVEFKTQLRALPDFKEKLVRVWEHARNSICRSLYTVDFITQCDLDTPVDGIWMDHPEMQCSNIRPGNRYDTGVEWTLDYAACSYRQLDKISFDPENPPKLIASHAKGLRETARYTDEELKKACLKTQSLVNWMMITNFALRNVSFTLKDGENYYPTLVFVGNSGMGEKISVTLPYKGMRFKIAK